MRSPADLLRFALVTGFALGLGVDVALAADEAKPLPALRMRDTAIRGDRQASDAPFQVPNSRSESSGTRRDYSEEILEPVVRSWYRADEASLGD